MRNQHKRITPVPPKEDLEDYYHIQNKTQVEIGTIYGVSQKVVFGWFKLLRIKSRVPFKRNQFGENNSSWKGDSVTYAALHYRVVSAKGKPMACEICGTNDTNKRYDWACVGDYKNINDYKRMCRSCHWKHDKTNLNFYKMKENNSPSKLIQRYAVH